MLGSTCKKLQGNGSMSVMGMLQQSVNRTKAGERHNSAFDRKSL